MKHILLGAAAAVIGTGAAQADTAAMQRCRTIAEAPARLACYDAIALPGLGSRAGWGVPAAGAPAPAAQGVAPGAAPAAATAPAGDPARNFGFEMRAAFTGPDRLDSRVVGKVQDFVTGTRFTLENGQVWQVTEHTIGFYNLDNPRVAITRGMLGSFYMSFEGISATPKVRRIQ